MHSGTNCSQLGILFQIQVRSESSDKWDHHCCFEHLRKGEWFHWNWKKGASVSSVAQSYPTLCNPMDFSMPGFPFHHQLLEFAQTHVYWVGDAIQLSHPVSPASPPAFNLSQHQGLFWCVSSSHQMASWSFSFSVIPSSEYSGLISFRIHWFGPLAVQNKQA